MSGNFELNVGFWFCFFKWNIFEMMEPQFVVLRIVLLSLSQGSQFSYRPDYRKILQLAMFALATASEESCFISFFKPTMLSKLYPLFCWFTKDFATILLENQSALYCLFSIITGECLVKSSRNTAMNLFLINYDYLRKRKLLTSHVSYLYVL